MSVERGTDDGDLIVRLVIRKTDLLYEEVGGTPIARGFSPRAAKILFYAAIGQQAFRGLGQLSATISGEVVRIASESPKASAKKDKAKGPASSIVVPVGSPDDSHLTF